MKNTTLERYDVENKPDTSKSLRNIGRSVIRALRLFEATSILKSREAETRGGNQKVEAAQQIPRKAIDAPEYPGRHNLEKGKTTVDALLKRNAQEKIDGSLAEGAQGKTFSNESGDFHFSSDLSGKIEGAPITDEELNNRTPMSPIDDLVIFPARPEEKKAPNNHLDTQTTALPTQDYRIPPQPPYSMN